MGMIANIANGTLGKCKYSYRFLSGSSEYQQHKIRITVSISESAPLQPVSMPLSSCTTNSDLDSDIHVKVNVNRLQKEAFIEAEESVRDQVMLLCNFPHWDAAATWRLRKLIMKQTYGEVKSEDRGGTSAIQVSERLVAKGATLMICNYPHEK